MKKDAYYFSHDSNARHDPKIMALRSIYGCEGYGWYWMMLEILREDSQFRFPLNKFQLMALAKELETNIEMLQKFLEDCYEIGLFFMEKDSEGQMFIISHSLNRRMCKYLETKEKLSIAGKKGGLASSKAKARLDEPSTIKGKESKVNESKLNKIKRKEKKVFIKPTFEEVREYCSERKSSINPKTFFNYYESVDWVKSNGAEVKNWKATVNTWEDREHKYRDNSAKEASAGMDLNKYLKEHPDEF